MQRLLEVVEGGSNTHLVMVAVDEEVKDAHGGEGPAQVLDEDLLL
jgi:hypothetical protein